MQTSSLTSPRAVPRVLDMLTWAAALYTAYVFIPADIGKFGAKPFPVHLFTILTAWLHIPGHEAQFRLITASAEVLATVLILLPWTRLYGALLALAVMSGAIFFHVVSPLGLDPAHDGGHLFMTACIIWVLSIFVIWVRRSELLALLSRLRGRLGSDRSSA
ncbi:hypothetical protein [Paraburkholderia sp.]|uniref:hypothetical protein n=1 Tax=Paraburkholderia sp. TaxID=1926495 RepID=UPI003D6E3B38